LLSGAATVGGSGRDDGAARRFARARPGTPERWASRRSAVRWRRAFSRAATARRAGLPVGSVAKSSALGSEETGPLRGR
jgi:hypothetical protein